VSVMISSFRSTVGDWLETTLAADIYISPPSLVATRATADVDPAITDRIRAIEGIDRVEAGRQVNVSAPDFPDLPPVNLGAGTGEITRADREFAWLTVPRETYWDAL